MSRIRCTNNWIYGFLPASCFSRTSLSPSPHCTYTLLHTHEKICKWNEWFSCGGMRSVLSLISWIFLIRLSWLRHGWSHLPVPNVRCSNSIRLSWLGFHLDHLGAGIPGHSLARWDSAWSSSRSVYWDSRCFRLVPSLVPKTWP